jgi:hypothetical protein
MALLVTLLLLVGIVLLVLGLAPRNPPRPEPMFQAGLDEEAAPPAMPPPSYGFPVVPQPVLPVDPAHDGPGRYHVIGVDRATEEDVELLIDAKTLANAKVKAELRGVVVTQIQKAG